MEVASLCVVGTLYLGGETKHGGWQDAVYRKLDLGANWMLAGESIAHSGVSECDAGGPAGVPAGEQTGLGNLCTAVHRSAKGPGTAKPGSVASRTGGEHPSWLGANAVHLGACAGAERAASCALDVQQPKTARRVFASALDGVVVGGNISGLAPAGAATRGQIGALGARLAALGKPAVAQRRGDVARAGAFGSFFMGCSCELA